MTWFCPIVRRRGVGGATSGASLGALALARGAEAQKMRRRKAILGILATFFDDEFLDFEVKPLFLLLSTQFSDRQRIE